MQIINESDLDVTWRRYNSDDWAREHTPPGGRGALAQAGRAPYNLLNNATGLYYVVFTNKGGSPTYAWWRPGKRFHFETHSPKLGRDQTVTLKGSSRYQVVNPAGFPMTGEALSDGYQVG